MVLAIGERSATGRYDVLCLGSFPGLIRGRTVAFFQICGIWFVLSAVFMMRVRNVVAMGPRCFRCIMEMLSGPIAGEFLACVMAVVMSVSV